MGRVARLEAWGDRLRYPAGEVVASTVDAWGRVVALVNAGPTKVVVVDEGLVTEVEVAAPGFRHRAQRRAPTLLGLPLHRFPLVEIDRGGIRTIRSTPVKGASGLAVAGGTVAFLGSYDDPLDPPGRYSVTFAQLADGAVESVETVPLVIPDGSPPPGWARHRVCRDNRLWLQFEDPRDWYVLEIGGD